MTKTENWLNSEIELDIEKVAHGGIFVARHQGRVVFVSHTATGEKVRAKVFEDKGGSFCRAETIEVLDPSGSRVQHIWKEADRLGAGGAEFGHLKLEYQRKLKTEVLTESLSRMGGIEREVLVMPVPGDELINGLGYRTRIQLHVSSEGVAGPYRERTHEVVPVKSLPLANTEINDLGIHLKNWQDVKRIEISTASTGGVQWFIDKKVKGDKKLVERAMGRSFRISTGGFWQVHRGAAELLAQEVVQMSEGLDPAANNLDLYGGVGLFSGALATKYGKTLNITTVESSKVATADATANLVDLGKHRAVSAPVEGFLKAQIKQSLELSGATVVLDPPRAGAGKAVIDQLLFLRPAKIIYVACDPVSLSRDLKILIAGGYQLEDTKAFDLFPHTHHFETIACLVL
jgi:SAM-dependent methyltransferases related to tRNA (uracil-5-)-methyltransferase